ITAAALEAWTLLAALAAQTSRLRLGVIVTSNRLRNPALLAKMAATTDIIAGGRLDFGIGAGGSRIAGAGDRVLRIVAEHADIWNYPGPPSAEFQQKNKVLDEHCAAIGRDPDEITRSMQTIVRCDDPQAPAATRALVLEMISAGVTHIVLAAILAGRPVQWLADQIIEPVIAEVQHR
ncbi:MAG TPA: LLM class flavin-dependent oxidoreductase, partial [Streptosporangiaceae bacterium]